LRFSRDTAFAQRWLDREYRLSAGASDYLGEWHVHPSLDAPPSLIDRASMWKIALSQRYETSRPLLLIVENELCQTRFRVYEFSATPLRCTELAAIAGDPPSA
jgi:integrative and conjugative element protein (TIGR02256 family)